MKLKKMNDSKILLDINKVTRIKQCEEAKNQELYGNLYNQILKYKKVSARDLKQDTDFDSKAISAITNRQIENNLFDKIRCEWIVDDREDRVEDQIPCQLCHQPNNRIYYIRNLLNGNKLNVGSTCVEEFIKPEDYTTANKKFDELQEQRKKEQRIVDFGQIEIEDPDFINNAYKKLVEIDILLPYSLCTNIDQVLYEINLLKINFVNKDGDYIKVSSEYDTLKNRYYELWRKAKSFYEKNKCNKLSCNKELSDWLKSKHDHIWIKVSKNNGLFDKDTLKYAYNSNYVIKHIVEFRKHISDSSIKIIGYKSNSLVFTLQNEKYKKPVEFIILNEEFMKNIGCYCLVSPDYKFSSKNLRNIIILEKTESNFYALYNRMVNLMRKSGLDIEKDDSIQSCYLKRIPRVYEASRWGNIDRVHKSDLRYMKIDIPLLYGYYTKLLFASDEVIMNEFENIYEHIYSNGKWISQKEKDERDKMAKGLTYSKQKSYIPY